MRHRNDIVAGQYDQYFESSILTANPLELVRILYRFVIDQLQDASRCANSGDIQGRGRAVSKATDGLMELLASLDHQHGDVSRKLADLYAYMATRVLQGHMDQDPAPFAEVERLMATMLDSWENLRVVETPSPEPAYGLVPETYEPISISF